MKSKKVDRLAPTTPSAVPLPPTQEQIAALAHAIWIDRGRPEGRDVEHWLEAERQLRGEARFAAGASETTARDTDIDPERSDSGRIERALDRVAGAPAPRSPTAL